MKLSDMNEALFFVGTFTNGAPYFQNAHGDGILTVAIDLNTGRLEHRHTYRDILNPDYLAFDPSRRMLFAVADNLTAPGHVEAFRVAQDGRLEFLSRQSSQAPVTCHVCAGEEVYAASYMDSCLTAHAVTATGISELRREFRYHGTGPNPSRQETSHAHQVAITPDDRQLYVCDLGADKIWIHRIENGRLAGDAPAFFALPAGSGPRHLEFHLTLPLVYVLCELNGQLLVLNRHTGKLFAELPAGDAAIRLRGGTIYTSNRADNTLSVFQLDDTGMPGLTGRFDTGVDGPRDFNIDPTGRWLIVAGQNSNTLVVHELSRERRPAMLEVKAPVCIIFAR